MRPPIILTRAISSADRPRLWNHANGHIQVSLHRNPNATIMKARSYICISNTARTNGVMVPFTSTTMTRSLSTASTIPASNNQAAQATNNTNGSDNNSNKDGSKNVSDYFLDNLGKVFFAAISSVIVLLVRSSYGTSNQMKQREILEETSLLDPLEIDDMRVANRPHFDSLLFSEIVTKAKIAFPSGEASYLDFVSVVMNAMSNRSSNEKDDEKKFSLQFGHLLDRIVIDVLENSDKYETIKLSCNGDDKAKLPLTFLFTILSLALSGSVQDRIRSLFEIMAVSKDEIDYEESPDYQRIDEKKEIATMSEADVIDVIGNLQNSCQLPSGPQVLATLDKYPIQQYRCGTPIELLLLAKEDALGLKSESADGESSQRRRYNVDEFGALLRSNFICAWGECYGPKQNKKIIKKN